MQDTQQVFSLNMWGFSETFERRKHKLKQSMKGRDKSILMCLVLFSLPLSHWSRFISQGADPTVPICIIKQSSNPGREAVGYRQVIVYTGGGVCRPGFQLGLQPDWEVGKSTSKGGREVWPKSKVHLNVIKIATQIVKSLKIEDDYSRRYGII